MQSKGLVEIANILVVAIALWIARVDIRADEDPGLYELRDRPVTVSAKSVAESPDEEIQIRLPEKPPMVPVENVESDAPSQARLEFRSGPKGLEVEWVVPRYHVMNAKQREEEAKHLRASLDAHFRNAQAEAPDAAKIERLYHDLLMDAGYPDHRGLGGLARRAPTSAKPKQKKSRSSSLFHVVRRIPTR